MVLLIKITEQLAPNPNIALINNAFCTFFVTTVYMLAWDTFCAGRREKDKKKIGKAILIALIPILLGLPLLIIAFLSVNMHIPVLIAQAGVFICSMLPSLFVAEGGALYVLLGLLLYIFREKRMAQIFVVLTYAVVYYMIAGGVQWAIALAAIPMLFYNGQKGRGMKDFFYIFYPTHIIILYLIATLMF